MSTATYKYKDIEHKWSKLWEDSNLYEASETNDKQKKYILVEFPYPSGSGLHCGHVMRFTLPDVVSRKLRMEGYNVLFPMGWDAFGLPAENYAIKTGIHPRETTKKAIETFKNQLSELGYSFDWSREVNTTDPNYYKWTQWIFLKLWENGLAELKEEPIWWCDTLKTVLANEEVLKDDNGKLVSERGEYPVERRMLKQWVLKMPEYAEKLLDGLKEVNFQQSIKTAQQNWIGKSVGAKVIFNIRDTSEKVEVFTTRPDTLFGVTALVLAPEHELAKKLADTSNAVKNYIAESANKTELDRISDTLDKSGVATNLTVIHPITQEELPVWISDYVVPSYGYGAIMLVPAHDERDYAFAMQHNIPIKQVIELTEQTSELPFVGHGKLINSGKYTGAESTKVGKSIIDDYSSDGFISAQINYKLKDWLFSRQRYWGEPIPLIHRQDGKIEAIVNTTDDLSVQEKLPLLLPDVPDYEPSSDALSPLGRNEEWVNVLDSNGNKAKRETNTMPNWAGSCWYYLRYIDPNNDTNFADPDKLAYWLPVDMYFGGNEHTTLHLLYSRFWHKFLYDLKLVPTSEPYKARMNGGILLGPDGQKMSKSKGNIINPDEKIDQYGADALRLYINFMGPYEGTIVWSEGGIKSCNRLIEDVYSLHTKVTTGEDSKDIKIGINLLIKNVGDMVDNYKTNTAVSEFMIFVNKAKSAENINIETYKKLLLTLAPFAPFITEELWQIMNENKWSKEKSIHLQVWPEFDEKELIVDQTVIGVQINGKLRGEILVELDDNDDTVLAKILKDERLKDKIEKDKIKKMIYLPMKIVNIIL